mgnify:CR=1 FL=1
MTAAILARREAHQHSDRSRTTPAFRWDGQPLDNVIASLLNTGSDEFLGAMSGEGVAALVDRAWYHGVIPLLHDRLSRTPASCHNLIEKLRDESRAAGMWELRHQKVVHGLGQTLTEAGIQALCFKGTALAYQIYEKPYLRTRSDTDLLVAEDDLERCRRLLSQSGFVRRPSLPGEQVSAEESWTLRHSDRSRHTIDLHWRINSAQPLANLFTFAELKASAEPLQTLGGLLVPDPVISLLIACMHRAVHRSDQQVSPKGAKHSGERLIWLLDVHLLSETFSNEDWQRFMDLAVGKGLAGAAREALQLAQRYFPNEHVRHIISVLEAAPASSLSDCYLRQSNVAREVLNIWSAERPSVRLRLLQDILLPPRAYLLWKYPDARVTWTPVLQIRRWMEGIRKRFAAALTGRTITSLSRQTREPRFEPR